MTKKRLIVCIWSVNTQTSQADLLDTRRVKLEKALRAAYACINQVSDGISPKGLFIAPEYLFAKPASAGGHSYGTPRHLEEGEKESLLQHLLALSRQMPGLLIIAGTVAWRKPFERSGGKLMHSKGPNIGQNKTVTRYTKAHTAISRYATEFMGGRTNRPLSGDFDSTSALSSADKTMQIISADYDASGVDSLAKNTAYVLLDGTQRFKYNKRNDFHEVLGGEPGVRTVYVPGMFDGRFDIQTDDVPPRTIQFGLEICLDHAAGTLQRSVQQSGQVDVHLITSAWVQPVPGSSVIKSTGYLVHASSYAAVSKVKFGTALDDVQPFGPATNVSGSPFALFNLTLESVPDSVPLPVATVATVLPSAPAVAPLSATVIAPVVAPVGTTAAPIAGTGSSSTPPKKRARIN